MACGSAAALASNNAAIAFVAPVMGCAPLQSTVRASGGGGKSSHWPGLSGENRGSAPLMIAIMSTESIDIIGLQRYRPPLWREEYGRGVLISPLRREPFDYPGKYGSGRAA